MADHHAEIRGGAGPDVVAAISAVIAQLLDDEAAARALPSRRPRQSSWVMAGRPREVPAPLPSHTFDTTGWSEAAEADEA